MTVAQTAAMTALTCKVPDWSKWAGLCRTLAELEEFRVTLLLQGRDTPAARRAIERRAFIISLKETRA